MDNKKTIEVPESEPEPIARPRPRPFRPLIDRNVLKDKSYDEIRSAIECASTNDTEEIAAAITISINLTWDEKTRLRELLSQVKGQEKGESRMKIDDFHVKTESEIPGIINKIVDALMKYADKVKQKRMYYSAHDQKWYPFDEEDKDKERGEIVKIIVKIQRLTDKPPKNVALFNEQVKFGLKNMIMGGIEG